MAEQSSDNDGFLPAAPSTATIGAILSTSSSSNRRRRRHGSDVACKRPRRVIAIDVDKVGIRAPPEPTVYLAPSRHREAVHATACKENLESLPTATADGARGSNSHPLSPLPALGGNTVACNTTLTEANSTLAMKSPMTSIAENINIGGTRFAETTGTSSSPAVTIDLSGWHGSDGSCTRPRPVIAIDIDKVGVRAPPEPSVYRVPYRHRREVVHATTGKQIAGLPTVGDGARGSTSCLMSPSLVLGDNTVSRNTAPTEANSTLATDTPTTSIRADVGGVYLAQFLHQREVVQATTCKQNLAGRLTAGDGARESTLHLLSPSLAVGDTPVSRITAAPTEANSTLATYSPMTSAPSNIGRTRFAEMTDTSDLSLSTIDPSGSGTNIITSSADGSTNTSSYNRSQAKMASALTYDNISGGGATSPAFPVLGVAAGVIIPKTKPLVSAGGGSGQMTDGMDDVTVDDRPADRKRQRQPAPVICGARNSQGEDDDDEDDTDDRLSCVPDRTWEDDGEAWLMDHLDAEITKAEERNLMERLDLSIKRLEEEEFVGRIMENIRDAEDLECARWLPSHVANVIAGGEENRLTAKETNIECKWESISTALRHGPWRNWEATERLDSEARNEAGSSSDEESETQKTNGDTQIAASKKETRSCSPSSKVEGLVEIKSSCLRSQLPKWAPQDENSDPRCNTTKELLFTRGMFQACVLDDLESHFPRSNNRYWEASITDPSPNDGPRDSYVLQASGPQEVMGRLKLNAELFVRQRILDVNVRRLLDDDDSLVMEVKVRGHNLGLRCPISMDEKGTVGRKGLWIVELMEGGEVAKALGNREIAKNGCVLLNINGFEIENHADFTVMMEELKVKRSSKKTKVTLCFSRYTDLEGVIQSSKLRIWMRDGRPFDANDHDQRRSDRFCKIAQTSNQRITATPIAYASAHAFRRDSDCASQDSMERATDHCVGETNERIQLPRKDRPTQVESGQKEARGENEFRPSLHDTDEYNDPNYEDDENEDDHEFDAILSAYDDPLDVEQDATSNNCSSFPRDERFLRFMEKYETLIALDYKNTGMQTSFVGTSMWVQHKRWFGDSANCDDSCGCISVLPKLSLTVVGDYIEKKKGQNDECQSALQVQTCGIFAYFAPRFLPLLKNEYPMATPTQLVQRLVDMWRLHQRAPNYGILCKRTCSCVDDWEQLFGTGDMEKASEVDLRKHPTHIMPRVGYSSKRQSRLFHVGENHDNVPISNKKARTIRHDTKLAAERPTARYPNNRSAPSTTPRRDTRVSQGQSSSSHSQTVDAAFSFQMTIDTTVPIGGYFRTERGQMGTTKCSIYSIFRNGQLTRDSRIVIGTIVEGAIVGGRLLRLNSHSQLQGYYEDSKRYRRNSLCLVFANRGWKPARSSHNEWDSQGDWTGPFFEGWPGGAHVAEREDNPDDETAFMATLDARHHGTPATLSSATHESVVDNVKNLTSKELLNILENVVLQDRAAVESVLQSQYRKVRLQIANLTSAACQVDLSPVAKERKKDLEAQRALLNIYINSTFLIERAMCLRNWSKIEIRVVHINLQMNITSNDFRGLRQVLSGVLLSMPPRAVVGHLPTRKLAQHVSYAKDVQAVYKIHNNIDLSLVERRLVIDVKAGLPEDGKNQKEVGSFMFSLDKIEKRCPSDTSWIDVSDCLVPQSLAFASSIKISARKCNVDRDYVMAKREEAIYTLKGQIENIEKFNQDPKIPQGVALSANVRGIGGVSLLHAALQLSEDSAPVEKLLSLGADPNAESVAGTPLTFAEDLVKRARGKLVKVKTNGASSSNIEAYETRLAQADKIFRILKLCGSIGTKVPNMM